MKKILSFIAVIAFILSACDNKEQTSSSKPVIKIGISVPLTGEYAHVGKNARGAAELALADLSKSDTKYNYVLITEDHAFDSKRVTSINQKFVSLDGIDAIISFSAKPGLLTSPIAEKNKIIHIGVSADTNVADGKYNFTHWVVPEKQAIKLVEKMKKEGVTKVAILTTIDQAPKANAEALKLTLDTANIKYNEYELNVAEINPDLLIQKIMRQNYDMHVLLLYSPTLDIAIKRFKEEDKNVKLTSVQYINTLEDKRIAEGIWYVNTVEPTGESYARFANYNQSENMYAVGNFYDAVNLIVQAFETADNKETAVDELTKIKGYNGILGQTEQDEKGIFKPDAAMYQVIDGKPVVIEE